MRTAHVTYPFGESLIVVSPLRDSLIILNSTARLIWEMLAAGQAPDVVTGILASHFGISREKAQEDAGPIIRSWNSSDSPLSFQKEDKSQSNYGGDIPSFDYFERDRQPASQHLYALSNVPCCIRFHSAEIESILQSVLGHLESSVAAPSHVFDVLVESAGYSLHKDGIEIGFESLPHSIRHELIYEIAKISFPDLEWLVFMHACAITEEERCIVLPGLPGCGKSTLTAALTLEGFCYVGEDIVPLSRRPWRIAPVPTRICLREGGWLAIRREYPEAQALPGGCRWGKHLYYLTPSEIKVCALPKFSVHCLIFPEYTPGQAIQMSKLSSEDKLARLIQTGAGFGDSLDEKKIEELLEWIQSTPGYQLRYGNLHDAVAAIKNLLHQ